MAKNAKTLENIDKHLTSAEIKAREQAEAEVLPERMTVSLKQPKYVKQDKIARRYWNDILKRMEGVAILDDLDTEMLGIYCAMLSRRDATQAVLDDALQDAAGLDGTERVSAVGKLSDLQAKLNGLEKTLLTYAEKLGLTPSSRAALARRRAAAVEEPDELFGD